MDTYCELHIILGNLISEEKANIPCFRELCNLVCNGRRYICHKNWKVPLVNRESSSQFKDIFILALKEEVDSNGEYQLYFEIGKSFPLPQPQLPSQQLPSQQLPSQQLPPQQLPPQQLPPQQYFPSLQLPPQQYFPSSQLPPQQYFLSSQSVPVESAYVKKERDPNVPMRQPELSSVPKRPLNPYMFYLKERRAELRAANTVITNREVCNLAGEEWQLLSTSEKAKYEQLFFNDRVRYQKELQQFVK